MTRRSVRDLRSLPRKERTVREHAVGLQPCECTCSGSCGATCSGSCGYTSC
ncbi:hypothetical protein [Micromonospora okii]|uniref:hypothetical protein n=1 Tax=Micromonospora okii TaxID=1182970 RepID=UPI001E5BBA44|nr:hypothetical protein [Micromonospora okii]